MSVHRLGTSVASLAAGVCYRTGLLRAVNYLANRFEWIDEPGRSPGFPHLRRRRGRNVQILTYHRVTPGTDPFLPSTPVRAFRRQMECLARHFTVLPMEEAVEAIQNDTVPDNAVVITFDDGYLDNYYHAYPILRRLSLPATVFLVTGVVGERRILWHDRVCRGFHLTSRASLDGIGPGDGSFPLDRAQDRIDSRDAVLSWLRRLDPEDRDEAIEELLGRLGIREPEIEDRLMLDWDEVREMHGNGISIGSHTVTHPILSRVSFQRARWEIVESKRQIEQNIDDGVRAFAFPNGKPQDYNRRIVEMLHEAGYSCAVTTVFGTNASRIDGGGQDLMELRRSGVSEPDPARFASKMNLYKVTS